LQPHDPEDADCARLAGLLPPDLTQLLYSLCLHGRAELGLAPDEYAALNMVLLRLLAFWPEGVEKKSLKTAESVRLGVAVAVAESAPAPAPRPLPMAVAEPSPPFQASNRVPAPSKAVSDEPIFQPTPEHAAPEPASSEPAPEPISQPAPQASTDQTLPDFWHSVVNDLLQREAVTALTRELALQSVLVRREADSWTLRVAQSALAQGSARERLQAALAQAGYAVRLELEIAAAHDTPAQRATAAAQARLQAAHAYLQQDPFVQAMQRDFGGKILPGSVQAL